jgi:hypothetical protein
MLTTNPAFKPWVRRPYGIPLLQEDTFSAAVTAGTPKWGVLISAGGALAQDTGVCWGGSGSAKLTTNAAIGNGAEIKSQIQALFEPGDFVAFEMKWTEAFAQGSTQFQFGVESRSHTQIKQARVQWTPTSGKWQYENAALSYVDFPGGAAAVEKTLYNAVSGTPLGWARIVIDPHTKEWVSFEAPYSDGTNSYLRTWDMTGIPLAINGASGTPGAILLPFVYVITQTATAEVAYTTDWCLSVLSPRDR